MTDELSSSHRNSAKQRTIAQKNHREYPVVFLFWILPLYQIQRIILVSWVPAFVETRDVLELARILNSTTGLAID